MRKFGEIYKQKVTEAEIRQENKILEDFKHVYSALLDHYGLKSVHELDDEAQVSFLTELNGYWSEKEGLNEKGKTFLEKRSMELNENSTAIQRKNFLREKCNIVINETIRQSKLKYKLYDIIDEMYKQINASDLSDVLSPEMITNIITETLNKTIEDFTSNIRKELKESATPKRKYYVRVKAKNKH